MEARLSQDKNFLFLIPSLRLDNNLLELLDNLAICLQESQNIGVYVQTIIVDDGSGPDYAHIFEKAITEHNCIVLQHAINLGKGRAF
jgi:glycosyltransferase involved in cell wall biosynthesis